MAAAGGASAGAGDGPQAPADRPRVIQNSPFAPRVQALLEAAFDVTIAPEFEAEGDFVAMVVHGLGRRRIDEALLRRFPTLKVVSNSGVGVDHIAVPDATARGILVGYTPGAMAAATADMAFALLLATARHVVEGDRLCRDASRASFDATWYGKEVSGAALGIVGLGRIGSEIARRARGFGMTIRYHNRRPLEESAARALGGDLEFCPVIEDLLRASDFVVLSCPTTPETTGLMSAATLAMMKPDAVLVNVGRGRLVDQAAVAAALEAGWLGAYATDVTEPEPLPRGHPLLAAPRVLLTPHTGSATETTRARMCQMVIDNIRAALAGTPMKASLNEAEVLALRAARAP